MLITARITVYTVVLTATTRLREPNLNAQEIEEEMEAIARSGLQEILILTGESKKMSSVEYIGEACKNSKKIFQGCWT